MQLIRLVLCIVCGVVIARLSGVHGLEHADWYMVVVGSLLAIGLYASTYGIVLQEARQHAQIILSAVTVGVVLKAAIIGGSLTLLFRDPFFLILGVAVAQIDPLSVAGLMKGSRLSAKAKTILASWASFDDPVTVILSLYVPVLVARITGADLGATATGDNAFSSVQALGLNLAFAGAVWGIWSLIGRLRRPAAAKAAVGLSASVYVLLAASLAVTVRYFMMLGMAVIGLFLRPAKIDALVEQATTWALRAAAVLLGLLLVGGIAVWKGIALGIAAYGAQIIAGSLLTPGLPRKDRWHIAFAQQNGITAIILALLFESAHPGTVAIVMPAIIVINSLHTVVNAILDRYVLGAEPALAGGSVAGKVERDTA